MLYYLLIKKHNQTGLKYLCKHEGTRKSCFVYCGSGIRWKRHLRKHGKDLKTEILFETNNKKEFAKVGKWFSKEFYVVKDRGWANLAEENGWGGRIYWGKNHQRFGKPPWNKGKQMWAGKQHPNQGKQLWGYKLNPFYGKQHSEATKKKMSLAKKGKYKKENSSWYGKQLSNKHRQKISQTKIRLGISRGKNNPMYGVHRFGEDAPHYGKTHSEETKKKMREAWAKRKTHFSL